MKKIIISSSPFVRDSNSVNRMFLLVSVSLLIPAIYGVMFFGVNALMIVAVSVIACFITELLYNIISLKSFFIDDFSFFVTGMTLGLVLPYSTPYYIVIFSGIFSILVAKMTFGGLGHNKFNPSVAGRCFAGILYPALSSEAYNMIIKGDVYFSLSSGGTNTLSNLIFGTAVGGIGTTCIILLVVLLLFLLFFDIVDYKIPLLATISYFVVSIFLTDIESALMNLCSGSFIFVASFMITDPNTSPNTLIGKLVYSVLFGVLSAVCWNKTTLGENTVFVIALLLDSLVPFMDKYFVLPRVKIGGFRNAYKN